MPVSEQDVAHVAALAALSVTPERMAELVSELNGILAHMDALKAAPTEGVEPMSGLPGETKLTRSDSPYAEADESAVRLSAPATRDGFFLVPRLDAHEGA